jgi:hypothetical protein
MKIIPHFVRNSNSLLKGACISILGPDLTPGPFPPWQGQATREGGNCFPLRVGEGRLLEIAQAKLGSPAQDVQDALILAVDNFVGDAPQFDDITLMVLVRDSGGVAT